ncbi:hypothetical protein IEQ34_009967 [Dendrobium chrysotoxum]|uniref:Uncharacterized protein n=1 Tax=Dendrobium chrysotoxum TaxID=161865 RepID=A0AAV7H3G1_DENCH|nr:hypothetical protein IEQ34_009967 [Dendrobium chrysotoxum]
MVAPSSSNPWGSSKPTTNGKLPSFTSLDSSSEPTTNGKLPSFTSLDNNSRSSHDVVSGATGISTMIFGEDVENLAAPFKFTLVGKFALCRPNLDMIHVFFGKPQTFLVLIH